MFLPTAKCCIRRQSPWSCGPGKYKNLGFIVPEKCGNKRMAGIFTDFKLGNQSIVFYIAVASGLVKLVGAQTGTGSRRIWLNGIAFVNQTFFVEFRKQIPAGFDIGVFESDIRDL